MRGVTCQQWRPLYVVQPPFSLNERARGCVFRSPRRGVAVGTTWTVPCRARWEIYLAGAVGLIRITRFALGIQRYVHDRGPPERVAGGCVFFGGIFSCETYLHMCTARKTSPPTTAYRFEDDGPLHMDNSDVWEKEPQGVCACVRARACERACVLCVWM